MTDTQSHENSTLVIVGSRNKPLIMQINSLFKKSRQSALTSTLIYANTNFSSLHLGGSATGFGVNTLGRVKMGYCCGFSAEEAFENMELS